MWLCKTLRFTSLNKRLLYANPTYLNRILIVRFGGVELTNFLTDIING